MKQNHQQSQTANLIGRRKLFCENYPTKMFLNIKIYKYMNENLRSFQLIPMSSIGGAVNTIGYSLKKTKSMTRTPLKQFIKKIVGKMKKME